MYPTKPAARADNSSDSAEMASLKFQRALFDQSEIPVPSATTGNVAPDSVVSLWIKFPSVTRVRVVRGGSPGKPPFLISSNGICESSTFLLGASEKIRFFGCRLQKVDLLSPLIIFKMKISFSGCQLENAVPNSVAPRTDRPHTHHILKTRKTNFRKTARHHSRADCDVLQCPKKRDKVRGE